MPFVFNEEELDILAERLADRLLPVLISALKRKATMKAKMLPANLMDVPELAARLNVDKKWIYRNAQDGVIPYTKAGKFLRFERAVIEDLIATGRLF